MCLAIPAKIVKLYDPDLALVEMDGVSKEINVSLLPDLNPGDYVIVHVGYALSRLDESEAEKTLGLFAQMEQLAQAEAREEAGEDAGEEAGEKAL